MFDPLDRCADALMQAVRHAANQVGNPVQWIECAHGRAPYNLGDLTNLGNCRCAGRRDFRAFCRGSQADGETKDIEGKMTTPPPTLPLVKLTMADRNGIS